MITREDLQVVYTDTSRPIEAYLAYEVNELLDQLEQRIKSLEAQLANTEQHTCESCSYFSWDGRSIGLCHNISPQCPRYTLTNFGCILHSKDTK